MPVNAAHVERSRYLAHFIVFIITLVGGALYALTSYFRGGLTADNEVTFAATVVGAFIVWSVLFLSFGAFFFIMSRIQTSAIIVVQVVSFFITIVVVITFSIVVAFISGSAEDGFYRGISIWNWILLGALLMLYVGSYFLSLYMYKRGLKKKGAI